MVTIDSDSARFSRALKSAILLPAGLIFLTAILLVLPISMLLKVVKLSEHSYDVLSQTRLCEKDMIDMETGVRGFLLEGDPIFLQSYDEASPHVDGDFARMKALVSDNSSQVLRADDLITAKNTWLQQARSTIAQRKAGKIPGEDWNKMGKSLMDNVRGKFEGFIQVEEGLRNDRLANVRRLKSALGFGGASLVLLLALTVGRAVRRQMMTLAADYRLAVQNVEQRHAALLRSEADLEEQKEWFRVTLTSIGDGVIVTDREGRVVFMNQEAENLTGWTGVEALLKPLPSIFRIVNETTRHKLEDPVATVLRDRKVVGMANHTVLISRRAQEWPIEDSAAPIYDSKGTMLGVVLVFHNASEMRQAQNALKAHSEELERKVAERTLTLQQAISELEAFSYTVSHDLRSPLRAMQGFAQAVLEDYGEKLDDQGKNYLQRIKNAAERLDRLIQDLLSYTRLARQDTPLVELDLDHILHEIIEHYPNLHPPAAHVTVIGTLPRIWGQEGALTQVLSNLLGNAAKFVPAGMLPEIKVWGDDRGDRVRLWIEDNGIGISPNDYERIFEMFVQVNESRLYGGTGVGLAIVRKAVEGMKGSVGVVSEPGHGSKFWVELNKA